MYQLIVAVAPLKSGIAAPAFDPAVAAEAKVCGVSYLECYAMTTLHGAEAYDVEGGVEIFKDGVSLGVLADAAAVDAIAMFYYADGSDLARPVG